MGTMIWRKQPLSEVKAADYDDGKYFQAVSDAITKGEKIAADNAKKGK